ncbi:hypothetical protein ABZZ17_20335 [Streptomyces sp. NPDC006512]|uniref:hypothetical protein n=1 Tax=Streptomyces sp. NPDC006512 TaxID=3154307 RepID=UPI0033BE87A9
MMQRLRVIRPTFRYPRCSTLPLALALVAAARIHAGYACGGVVAAAHGAALTR